MFVRIQAVTFKASDQVFFMLSGGVSVESPSSREGFFYGL